MTRGPRTTLPVPDLARCQMYDSWGRRCAKRLVYRGTRPDGSTIEVCPGCAKRLRELAAKRPDLFDQRRFTEIK